LTALDRPRIAAPIGRKAGPKSVIVACPDARPPAYQAVVGLAAAGRLDRFVTGFYHRADGPLAPLGRWPSLGRILNRRHDPEIPDDRVLPTFGFDLALAAENRIGARAPALRRRLARLRTRHFDRLVARAIDRQRPAVALVFSDVASEVALPRCRALGVATVLSMVHGDVREEALVLDREREAAPDFFPIYLADGPIDEAELAWLHARRLRDIEQADVILVPSDHIAAVLARHGTPRDRIRVVPYAADTRRFVPESKRVHARECTFLFAGGVTQRKGIKYLLEAWRLVRRPGWRLQLLGPLPGDPTPLAPYRDEVDWLGRVGHAEVPARMAAADVFVFPSLFEGSAVVTYEALACGLPSVVTAEAGSVVRDGRDGLIVPAGDVESLAKAMERMGDDPEFRAACSASARARAEAFDWPRYHAAVVAATEDAARP
jgi:glycosyltransferase involved in cell wall biosynthesis